MVEKRSIPKVDGFEGSIAFDIQISHGSLGNLHLRGEFPRIKPQLLRAELSKKEHESMRKIPLEWAAKYFEISKRTAYFIHIIDCSILLTVYGDPWSPLNSSQMEFGIKMMLWDWICDDIIEEAPNSGIPFSTIRCAVEQLLGQMNFKHAPSIENVHPYFLPLVTSLESMRSLILELHTNYEQEWPFQRRIRRKYFEGCQYRLVHPPLSSEMYIHWRKITAYNDGTLLRFAMTNGVIPSETVLESAEMGRLFEVINAYGGIVNDVAGIRKDIENEEDNVILFKLKEGKSVEAALSGLCAQMRQGRHEYLQLQKVLLEMYPAEKNLIKFFQLMDCLSDSQNRIYVTERYNRDGDIQLKW